MNNSERQQLLSRFRSSGMPGSILDVFSAHAQGRDIIAEYQKQQNQQQSQEPAVATTPEQQREGLRPYHAAGDTQKSMIFKDVPSHTPFNTEGMKVPIDIKKVDKQGHLIESHKSIPPGVKNIPTGPYKGDIIETPSEGYKKGGFKHKAKKGGVVPKFGKIKRKQRGGYRYFGETEPVQSDNTRVNMPSLPRENIQLISESDENNFSDWESRPELGNTDSDVSVARLSNSALKNQDEQNALPREQRTYPSKQDYRDVGVDPFHMSLPNSDDIQRQTHEANYGLGHSIETVAIAPYIAGPAAVSNIGLRTAARQLWKPLKTVLSNKAVQVGFGAEAMIDARTRIADVAKGRRWENGKWVDGRTWTNAGMLALDATMVGAGIKSAKGLLTSIPSRERVLTNFKNLTESVKSKVFGRRSPYEIKPTLIKPPAPVVDIPPKPGDGFKNIIGSKVKKDFFPSTVKNLDDVVEYTGISYPKIRESIGEIPVADLMNKNFVQDVLNRYAKGGKNAKEYIADRIKELKSPEGMKRLIAQEKEWLQKIGWEPHGGLSAKDKAQFLNWKATENANARITELKGLKVNTQESTNEIPIGRAVEILRNEKTYTNASWTNAPRERWLDDMIGGGEWEEVGFNTYNRSAPYRIGSTAVPTRIKIGLPYTESIPTIGHEVGHSVQAGRHLVLDADAIKLLTPKSNLNSIEQAAYNYFVRGGILEKSLEPSAFLHELREAMLLRGIIKSRHQTITPHIIETAKVSFRNKPMGTIIPGAYNRVDAGTMTSTSHYGKFVSDHRILDFMDDSKEVTKSLAGLLNRLPAYIPVAAATGATAVASDNISAQSSYNHMNSLLNVGGPTSNNNTSAPIEIGE